MFNESWLEFMVSLETAKAQLGLVGNQECFYRGHTNTNHKLVPGLLRTLANDQQLISVELWEAESSMFYEFRARAKEIHQGNLTDWDVLFYMQHHGVKTRLLDWTENVGVAIYFALLGSRESNFSPCIWLMNPYKLNGKYHKSADLYSPENLDDWDEDEEEYFSYSDLLLENDPRNVFWWDKPVALYPIRRVDRLTTQGGYFTIHGNDSRPIDQIIPENLKIWKKVIIPNEALHGCRRFLEYSGINHFTMFPDLDGLAKFLNAKNFN